MNPNPLALGPNPPRREWPGHTHRCPGDPGKHPQFNPYSREWEWVNRASVDDIRRGTPTEACGTQSNHSSSKYLEDFVHPSLNSIFQGLTDLITQVDLRRRDVERRMESLKDAFNKNMPRSRLRLRPWNRKKGDPPYALYWISLFKRRQIIDERTSVARVITLPRWFRRLKIRTSRELDTAIHRAGLDVCRKAVHYYHNRARALNEAHQILSRAFDSARKMLRGRTAGRDTLLDHPPLPDHPRFYGFSGPAYELLGGAWKFAWVVQQGTLGLQELSTNQNRSPSCGRMRLDFVLDRNHPYGRLLWRDTGAGITLSRLDDLTKRRLRLPRQVREGITPWELERRRVVRILKKRTNLLRCLRQRLTGAFNRTKGFLQEDDTMGYIVDPVEYRFTVPEPTW